MPAPLRLSRRSALPLLGAAALSVAGRARPAEAGVAWCKTDPVVRIGGRQAHVYVSSPRDVLSAATGPTDVVIAVPVGMSTELVSTDSGFGYGWTVRFAESVDLRVTQVGIEVRVNTFVPATSDLIVVTDIADASGTVLASSLGKTNSWVSAKAWL